LSNAFLIVSAQVAQVIPDIFRRVDFLMLLH
jgi:hypothetical protein